jgi:hypothetical protein
MKHIWYRNAGKSPQNVNLVFLGPKSEIWGGRMGILIVFVDVLGKKKSLERDRGKHN